ncbi:hypothetical protein [Hungatella sp. SB206]|uniref:hypothetical protein n=1 Tax=Hungatella sp. SB206 TaxID=2937758 RepID=UPI003DA9039D
MKASDTLIFIISLSLAGSILYGIVSRINLLFKDQEHLQGTAEHYAVHPPLRIHSTHTE